MLEWNNHQIWNTVTAEAPEGIHVILYHLSVVRSSGKVIFYHVQKPTVPVLKAGHVSVLRILYLFVCSSRVRFIVSGLPSLLLFLHH